MYMCNVNLAEENKTKNKKLESHYEVGNDNVQRQSVYFIVAIRRNTRKSFLSQFLLGKAI